MKRRIGAFLLALCLSLWLLPAAALASESGTPGETQEETGGETGGDSGTDAKLSDGTSVDSEDGVTRAQLAEMIYTKLFPGETASGATKFTDIGNSGDDDTAEGNDPVTDEQWVAINVLANKGILSGTSKTTFTPGGTVSYAQAAVVLWRATGSKSCGNEWAEKVPYSDFSLSEWYGPAVMALTAAEIITGTADGSKPSFPADDSIPVKGVNTLLSRYAAATVSDLPEGGVTRASMAVKVYETYKDSPVLKAKVKANQSKVPFTDTGACTDAQKTAIGFLYKAGIVQGYNPANNSGQNLFGPDAAASSLQIAMLLKRCAEAVADSGEPEAQSVLLRSAAEDPIAAAWAFLEKQSDDETFKALLEAARENPHAPAANNRLGLAEVVAPETPTFSPESGMTFTESLAVTLNSGTAEDGTVIWYTTDGSDPSLENSNRQQYSAEAKIPLEDTTTIKAVAVKNNLVSEVAEATYTIQEPEPALSITAEPASLTGAGTVTLAVSDADTGAEVSVACTSNSSIAVTPGTIANTWTATLPNATASYTFTASADGYTDATITVQVTAQSSGNTGGSSGGSSGRPSTTTETVTNPDGSTTTTTTNKATGTVTETTRYPDGAREVVETKKDGTVTTTSTDADGSETAVVENPDGSREVRAELADGTSVSAVTGADGRVQAEVSLSSRAVSAAQEEGSAVTLPMPEVPVTADREAAPTVTVNLPDGTAARVEIPVAEVTPGTVAVLVRADGSEEVVRTSLTTETGVTVALSDGDTVKLVDNTKTFSDVPAGHWAAEEVAFAASRELFQGTGGDTFAPEAAMSRAMILTVLARLEGVDTSAGDTWYSAGLQWAVEAGISDGSAPEQGLTREQLALMLYRYAGQPDAGGSLGGFADGSSVSGWAAQGMAWAVEEGLISGVGGNTLSPQGEATRAQVAAILARFFQLL